MMSAHTEPSDQPHVVFTGGGTAGHVVIGLAVAERLFPRSGDPRITWIGSGSEMERRLIGATAAGAIDYRTISTPPLPRRLDHAPAFACRSFLAFLRARSFLRREHVRCVVGTGGYVSTATARAALHLGIPLILLEPNAVAGRANRWLARRATVTCLAFEEARDTLPPGASSVVTGTPVRAAFFSRGSPAAASPSGEYPKNLLILGGSGGDRSINQLVPAALARLSNTHRSLLDDWRITHQTGRRDAEPTRARYRQHGVGVTGGVPPEVTPFLEDMPARLPGADLVISRSGGATLAELGVVGAASILIPYARSADDHQRRTAQCLADRKAAVLFDPDAKNAEFRSSPAPTASDRLASLLQTLLCSERVRRELAMAMRQATRTDAAEAVADLVAQHILGQTASAVPKAA